MNALVIIIPVLCLFALVLLIVPWRIRLRGWADHQKGFSYSASLDWGLGVLRVDGTAGRPWQLSVLRLTVVQFARFPKPKKKKKKKKAEKKSSPLALAGIIRSDRHIMIRILGRMTRAAFLKGHLRGRIGLPDPADTARMALLCRSMRLASQHFNLVLDWVYDDEVVDIHADLGATFVIGFLLLSAGGLLLDRQTRVMLRRLRHA